MLRGFVEYKTFVHFLRYEFIVRLQWKRTGRENNDLVQCALSQKNQIDNKSSWTRQTTQSSCCCTYIGIHNFDEIRPFNRISYQACNTCATVMHQDEHEGGGGG
jgi:hypothetical protein